VTFLRTILSKAQGLPTRRWLFSRQVTAIGGWYPLRLSTSYELEPATEDNGMRIIVDGYVRIVMLISLILTAALMAGPATGQDVDTKGDKELREQAQKIDKAADGANSGRVTPKIVGEFTGKTFDFGDGKGPRALTAQDVQNLRSKGLGFGEVTVLLALANRTGQSPSTILQLRQSGLGWGQIAQKYDVKLGPVIKSVKATEHSVDRVARAERAERVEKAEKLEKPDRAEKFEKPDRLQRVERPERPERPGR
jgi:hypothetical protein